MAVLTEPNRLNDVLKSDPDWIAKEAVVIASGQNLKVATVIGKISISTPTEGTADGGNTGNGTCTAVTAGEDTQLGTYTIECIEAVANGGKFKVVAPNGEALPDAAAGTAFTNEQLNFTLNDGSTDFAIGDKFTVTITAGSGKVTKIDFSALDGS